MRQAYLQLEVAEQDKELLTINTHKGLYRCNRLIYGIASAPAIWQRTIENILRDIPGVIIFLDDIKIAGRDEIEHFEHLEKVLQRLSKFNIRINLEKCKFFKDQIQYCGYIIDKNGIHKDGRKIEAIQDMPRSKNVIEARAFLGMVNYYGRFVKNLSNLVYPLNCLLKFNTDFIWSREYDKAFNGIKEQFQSKNFLVHYDSKLHYDSGVGY